ncbi:MAG: hypothetical protein LBV03_00065 [Fusobacteriales bacterium]|jgi:hypothetical protein|nr:hypothetical protein [Fusobacteriales bacterium]
MLLENFYKEIGITIKQIINSFGNWDRFCRIAKPFEKRKEINRLETRKLYINRDNK